MHYIKNMININERLKLSDFNFYYFEDDLIYNNELEYKGLKTKLINNLKMKENIFKFKYDSLDVLLIFLKELINHHNEDNLIIGLNNFNIPLVNFEGFKTSKEIYEKLKDEWKLFGATCYWEYAVIVKIQDQIYFINDKIETHIHFPPYKGDNLFKLLVLPNKYKQFIHLEDFTEEEKNSLIPKVEVFRKIENYFYNNFYNCTCLNLKDLK